VVGRESSKLNVSTLDIPSPIDTEANGAALLAETVKRARALQI